MAKTIGDSEERDKRIKLIGDYYRNHDTSIRKTASFFTENFFEISTYTVKDYLERYKVMYPSYKNIIDEKLKNNKPSSIEDENVKNRVMEVTRLFKSGLMVKDIADYLGLTSDIVYRDLVERLPKINLQEAKEVSEIMKKNRYNNLINQNIDNNARLKK